MGEKTFHAMLMWLVLVRLYDLLARNEPGCEAQTHPETSSLDQPVIVMMVGCLLLTWRSQCCPGASICWVADGRMIRLLIDSFTEIGDHIAVPVSIPAC